jgi:hypothetical protein
MIQVMAAVSESNGPAKMRMPFLSLLDPHRWCT